MPQKQLLEMNFSPHPSFLQRARFFYEKYDVSEILGTGDDRYSRRTLKKRSDRICRFCKRGGSETTFNNESHLVSRFMGNTDLFSDFECDECNSKFSLFETELSYFIGISRSITGLHGERKAPSFVASRLSVKSRSFIGQNILILAKKDLNEENTEENRRAGKTTITYTKPPYIPSNVYKALMKSALSILSKEEVEVNYIEGIKYLQAGGDLKGAHINGYTLPFDINMPLHVQVYKKRNAVDNIPTHVFGFYFQNHIIYLPLPLHKDDFAFHDKEIEMPYAPPYFLVENPVVNIIPTAYEKNLSSNEKLNDDKETMIMMINPNSYKSGYKYDPNKDEFLEGEYNPINTKFIIITKAGTVFTKNQARELTEFLKNEEVELTAK